jgi:hypothetical protein
VKAHRISQLLLNGRCPILTLDRFQPKLLAFLRGNEREPRDTKSERRGTEEGHIFFLG